MVNAIKTSNRAAHESLFNFRSCISISRHGYLLEGDSFILEYILSWHHQTVPRSYFNWFAKSSCVLHFPRANGSLLRMLNFKGLLWRHLWLILAIPLLPLLISLCSYLVTLYSWGKFDKMRHSSFGCVVHSGKIVKTLTITMWCLAP